MCAPLADTLISLVELIKNKNKVGQTISTAALAEHVEGMYIYQIYFIPSLLDLVWIGGAKHAPPQAQFLKTYAHRRSYYSQTLASFDSHFDQSTKKSFSYSKREGQLFFFFSSLKAHTKAYTQQSAEGN